MPTFLFQRKRYSPDFGWDFAGQANTIGTGQISMSLLESNDTIAITNALPISDSRGKILGSDDSFDFAITTHATGAPGNISYSISITKATVDSGYTALGDNQVKVYLTALSGEDNEVQVVKPTLVNSIITSGNTGNFTFDSGKTGYLTHSHASANTTKTTKYRLRMWVDSAVDASNWNQNTKLQYKLKVGTSGTLSA